MGGVVYGLPNTAENYKRPYLEGMLLEEFGSIFHYTSAEATQNYVGLLEAKPGQLCKSFSHILVLPCPECLLEQ